MTQEVIFVQIASYRDDELPKTIQSCLESAKYPERLRFGIVHQVDDETRHLIDAYKDDERFRITEMEWQDSRGVGYARNLCNRLYDGEEFTMQIDSHMRFDADWDVQVLEEWHSCHDDMAVLSAYPSPFIYEQSGEEKRLPYGPTMLIVNKFANQKVPVFKGIAVAAKSSGALRRAAFTAGGFTFGRGKLCQDVPYTAEVCFTGEEMVYSLRLFSHGYNIYTPNKLGIYHLYERPDSSRFWSDMPKAESQAVRDKHAAMNKENDEFLQALFEGKAADVLGQARTLREFENFSGVSFQDRLVHPDQAAGKEPPLAYSDEWRGRDFGLQDISITIDFSGVDMGDQAKQAAMWRIKLLSYHGVEVFSRDVPIARLCQTDFKVSFDTQVSRTPIDCRIRPYMGGDEWLDPVILPLKDVLVGNQLLLDEISDTINN